MAWLKLPPYRSANPLFEQTINNLQDGIESAKGGAIGVSVRDYGAGTGVAATDTAAFKKALAAGKEGAVEIPPGYYKINETLEVPATTTLYGTNRRTCVLEVEGERELLRLGAGDVTLRGFGIRATAPQAAAGSGIDFSKGFTTYAHVSDMMIGSNFFNSVNMVGAGAVIGAIDVHDILFYDPLGTALKGIGNAVLNVGASTKRVVAPTFYECHGEAATAADVPLWIELNNSDSVQFTDCLWQAGKNGLRVGNADTSSQKTTNLYMTANTFDTMSEIAYNLAKLKVAEFTACHAQTGVSAGVYLAAEALGVTLNGCTIYNNESHGIVANTVHTGPTTIIGCKIVDNGKNKAAGTAGINMEEKAEGLLITGNQIGNFGLGNDEQKLGLLIGKKCANTGVFGNRIAKNPTANIKLETETTGIKSVAEMETQNLMT